MQKLIKLVHIDPNQKVNNIIYITLLGHVDSVKAIRFQMEEIREALLQVSETGNDDKICSESRSLATNELGDYEFIVGIVLWYEILYAINLVSKQLQEKDMLIDVAIEKVKGLISFFTKYREIGFFECTRISKRNCTKNGY